MGREANCTCSMAGEVTQVHALLETDVLILRGGVKKTIALPSITRVDVEAGMLRLHVGRDLIELGLGDKLAASWAKKLASPPPTLAKKLGLAGTSRALLIGVAGPELTMALDGCQAATAAAADLTIAVVLSEDDVTRAERAHRRLRPGAPIWMIHGKGKSAPVGEAAVRDSMRGLGYMDNKVCSVSSSESGTRYARRIG